MCSACCLSCEERFAVVGMDETRPMAVLETATHDGDAYDAYGTTLCPRYILFSGGRFYVVDFVPTE